MPQINGNSDQTAVSMPEASAGRGSSRRVTRRFVGRSAVVIIVCVLACIIVRDVRTAKKLRLIAAAANDYATNMQSFAGRFETSCHGSAQGISQDAEKKCDFVVDTAHNSFLLDSWVSVNFSAFPGTTFRFRDVTATDGVWDRHLTYSRRAPQSDGDDWGEPHVLTMDHVRSTLPQAGPWYLIGLIPIGHTTNLAEQFENAALYGKFRYDGAEVMHDALCERVTIDLGTGPLTFWLDPACGYLPRRQQLAERTLIDVFEFQEFTDETSRVTRWFPSRGRYDCGGFVTEIVVKELKMNPAVDAKTFQIDVATLPDGVQVIEIHNNRMMYTGGREDLWKAHDQEHEAGMEILRQRAAGTQK